MKQKAWALIHHQPMTLQMGAKLRAAAQLVVKQGARGLAVAMLLRIADTFSAERVSYSDASPVGRNDYAPAFLAL